ncbi:hypothetical protein [Anaerofustis stercorihominis]|uniref:hypothetical protein n=1 Tax=Anaerofustis stercorihominis TaxID=214853 RepID=UPI0039841DF1
MSIKENKKKVIAIALIGIVCVVGIAAAVLLNGNDAKSKALNEISDVEVTEYFKEDQTDINKLIDEYKGKIEKADDKDVDAILKEFKKELSNYHEREDVIDAYLDEIEKQVDKLKGDKKKKAEKLLDSYEDKLEVVESKEEFAKLSKELEDKLKEDSKVTVKVENNEVAEMVTEVKQDTKTYSNSNSSSSKKNNSSSNKGNSSSGSSNSGGSTKPSHTHSWNKHYATGYKTETYQVSHYVCSCGIDFGLNYDAAYDHQTDALCNFGERTVTETRQVPYQYVDYYYCSCGATR